MARDLEVNNTQEFSLGDLTALDGLAQFAIATWCQLESTGSNRTLFGRDDGSHAIRHYFTTAGQNGVADIPKLLVTVGGVTARAEPTAAHASIFNTGVPHHFGSQWMKGATEGMQLWWDGQKLACTDVNTTGQSADVPNSSATCYLGRRGSTTERWDGMIGWVTIWRVWLGTEEWAALAAGCDPLTIRPEDIVLHTYLEEQTTDDVVLLPQSMTQVTATAAGTPAYVAPFFPAGFPQDAEAENEYAPMVADDWGPWHTAGEAATNSFRDTGRENGRQVRYRVRAVDTSGNSSATSASTTTTPNTGTPGPNPVCSHWQRAAHIRKALRRRSERRR